MPATLRHIAHSAHLKPNEQNANMPLRPIMPQSGCPLRATQKNAADATASANDAHPNIRARDEVLFANSSCAFEYMPHALS